MSDGFIFILFFGGLMVARIVAATVIFSWLLPRGSACPNCDNATLRIENGVWDRIFPWLRKSWCYECEWEGMLRVAPVASKPSDLSLAAESRERKVNPPWHP
jgi:hypothetical protein